MNFQNFIALDGLLALKVNLNKRKIMTVVLYVQNFTESIERVLQQIGMRAAMKLACVLSFFVSLKTKFWIKKRRALFIKYLVVAAMGCTSVKQA